MNDDWLRKMLAGQLDRQFAADLLLHRAVVHERLKERTDAREDIMIAAVRDLQDFADSRCDKAAPVHTPGKRIFVRQAPEALFDCAVEHSFNECRQRRKCYPLDAACVTSDRSRALPASTAVRKSSRMLP